MNYHHQESVILTHFPEELITRILVRLPAVKSFLRFRCVSKSFCTLIDSRYFINLHLNRSANNRTDHIKLIFTKLDVISTNYNLARLCVSDLDKTSSYKLKLRGISPNIEVYGYCNGVFLLLVNSFILVLWNPSTHKHKTLPPCPFKSGGGSSPSRYNMGGLGYDSTCDDYKVVFFATVKTFGNPKVFDVWIFGLKSNSWRMVQTDDFFPKESTFLSVGYFAHGHNLYWKCMLDGYDYDYYSQDIVAFDVSKETFSRVAQPLYPTTGSLTNLHVLDGCLCISFLSKPRELAVLYIRKKDGAEFTWSILYSVTTAQLPSFLDIDRFKKVQVLGYSKEGDHKIMLNLGYKRKHKHMISYDVKEKSFQSTTIACLSNDGVFGIPCFESLVSVGDGDGGL